MIYLKEEDVYIKDPNGQFDELLTEIKNYLRENMKNGLVLVVIPEHITDKNRKREYKAGFLFELLSLVYPENTKTQNLEIISDKFHMFCGYRQFNNLLGPYEQKRIDFITQQ